MAHVKVTNGVAEDYSMGKLRRDNPNVSFPKRIPADVLAAFNVYELTFEEQPSFDPDTQTAYEKQTPVLENGQWVRKWVIQNKTAEELSAESEAKSASVRGERDSLLSGSDWTQVADAPVDQAAWATYRQALRDIPDQAGFPDNVQWPVAPE